MKAFYLFILITIAIPIAKAQTLYFPPATGSTWDTLAPPTLGWCQPNIDSFYNFLQAKNTVAFIVLKDGKIVLEKYFGTFTVDSIHIWNSASKSLSAMMTGITQEHGLIHIDSPATHYLGAGWTSETPAQEDSITVRDLITMTSGTNPQTPAPCTNEDTGAACLQYLVPAGTAWAYHTGAYRKVQNVMSNASGTNYNALSENYIGSATGMTGAWVQQVFYSTPRTAARFGLLSLNHGIWASDTLLHDTAYFRAMTTTSQAYNLSYGYLWWLNGKASYMLPGYPLPYPGSLIPNAPADMFCALGKDDQKIYVIPSTNMVIVRMGNAADSSTDASSAFDNELWGRIDSLGCVGTGIAENSADQTLHVSPNPTNGVLYIQAANSSIFGKIAIYNMLGEMVVEYPYVSEINISQLPAGLYVIRVNDVAGNFVKAVKVVKE